MAEHKQVKLYGFEVDEGMYNIVKALNDAGITTLFSCQGWSREELTELERRRKLLSIQYGGPMVMIKEHKFAHWFCKNVASIAAVDIELSYWHEHGFRYTFYFRDALDFWGPVFINAISRYKKEQTISFKVRKTVLSILNRINHKLGAPKGQTFSYSAYAYKDTSFIRRMSYYFLNAVFFWERNHCRGAYLRQRMLKGTSLDYLCKK